MKHYHLVLLAVILVGLLGCKKENRIRHELSGTWTIEKSEVTTYTNGVADNTTTRENLGSFELQDYEDIAEDYNRCYFDFAQGFWPLGFSELANTNVMQEGYCRWYGDLRARDRLTFWLNGGFGGLTPIFVIYTRVKNANGPGRQEEWMYLNLDANGNFEAKEILYVKLTNSSGKPQ